jgi:hypothetical protein
MVLNASLGGFISPLLIFSKTYPSKPILTVEMDGKADYPSHEVFEWEIFREQIMTRIGITYYRTWYSHWWQNPDKEKNRLIAAIKEIDTKELKNEELLEKRSL